MRLTRRRLAWPAVVGLLAGCAAPGQDAVAPTPSAPSSASTVRSPSSAPLVTLAVRDGSTRPVTTKESLLGLDARESDVVRTEGGAVVVRDGAGHFLLLVGAPTVRLGPASPVTGQWVTDRGRLRAVAVDGKALNSAAPVRITAPVGRRLVSSVDRETWQGKPRWTITPSELGREAPLILLQIEGWAQARELGAIPESTSLRNQFVCHPASLVARSKPSWNIEAARNASNLWDTMAAGCNP
ncbi:DUF2599 domain-containing protein [Luteococcus japonicus]|uniref:DUF2599 domain-containing protein n=1 Tax=Luteococcus japonicus LSP_Lj1 TaxID=1255658 RepID=A0A1R4IYZ1_9ACTN|nr:DUF2599 domain-containing protein [Luteococcus japonicus]SJN25060.1 hypothetical protein FM114_04570 [Luteococcus japonicus LSP_Lj1]